VTLDPLTGELRLNRPPFGELVPEMDAVRLAGVHEDMRSRVTDIVTASCLHTYFAQIRLSLCLRYQRKKHHQYYRYTYAHYTQNTKYRAKLQQFFDICK
jgi:hypothetical protein